jgi:hypothetical protein
MGLDLTDLNLQEPLRSWYRSGLRYLLPPVERQGSPEAGSTPLPEPWHSLSAQLDPPHPHVWTYWELALDLSGHGDPERFRLFRRILQSLQWPEENVIFWPPAHIEQGELVLRADIFWQGVEWIRPGHVTCFGREAFRRLFPDRAGRYGSFRAGNHTLVYLPGPEDMLPDNRRAKQLVWRILRTLPSE